MGLDMYLMHNGEQVAYWRKANAIHHWFEDCSPSGCLESCEEKQILRSELVELRDACSAILDAARACPVAYHDDPLYLRQPDGRTVNVRRAGTRFVGRSFGPVLTGDALELAEQLIPTQEGFFFGETDYGEWYLHNLSETVRQLDAILSVPDDGEDYVYFGWY